MAEIFDFKVSIDGQQINGITNMMVQQTIFGHHHFSFTFPLNSVVDIENQEGYKALEMYIGKGVVMQWETKTLGPHDKNAESSVFKGFIDEVSLSGGIVDHHMVVVKGHSPTISMDGAPRNRSFYEVKPEDIFSACVKESSGAKTSVNASFRNKLSYIVQHEESNFSFLCRLMFDLGEWFFYDGETMCLGINGKAATHKISNYRISSLDVDYRIPPTAAGIKSSTYKTFQDEVVQNRTPDTQDSLVKRAVKEGKSLYPGGENSYVYLPSRDPSDKVQMSTDELTAYSKSLGNKAYGDCMVIHCSTDYGGLRVGDTVALSGTAYVGDFYITSITHSAGSRNYMNHFEAIPKGSLLPAVYSPKRRLITSAVAQVTNNNDPDKMGRVKVKFFWDLSAETPWLRVVTPYAGDTRGLYFIPEVGDEVMVGFEMGIPEFPYVMGSLYNGKHKFDDAHEKGNKFKSIKTKGGNEILFNEDGIIQIRNQKNQIEITTDQSGRITIQSDGEIAINAKADINITAGGKVGITSGGDMAIKAGGNGELKSNSSLTLGAGQDIKMEGSNATLKAKVNAKIEGAMTALEGSGVTTVKGGLVKIN